MIVAITTSAFQNDGEKEHICHYVVQYYNRIYDYSSSPSFVASFLRMLMDGRTMLRSTNPAMIRLRLLVSPVPSASPTEPGRYANPVLSVPPVNGSITKSPRPSLSITKLWSMAATWQIREVLSSVQSRFLRNILHFEVILPNAISIRIRSCER